MGVRGNLAVETRCGLWLGAAAPLLDRSLICALHCTVCSRLLKPYFWPSSLADRVRAFTCFALLGMAKLCTLVPCRVRALACVDDGLVNGCMCVAGNIIAPLFLGAATRTPAPLFLGAHMCSMNGTHHV